MRNDRGFTVLELVIVIVIMSLLAVGAITGYSILTNGDTRKAANAIINSLDLIQIENMAKASDYRITISQDSNGDYYLNTLCDETIISSERLKLKNGSISYETLDKRTISVTGSNKLELAFRKDTGGVKENGSGQIITAIIISGADNSMTIRLITTTGKHFIE